MDLLTRIQLIIGGDASGVKKAADEAIKQTGRVANTAANQGKQAGDNFGREMARAQDRWLKVAEGAFRKYGGTVGGVIGDLIQQYERFGKAMDATNRIGAPRGGRAAGQGAGEFASTAGGDFTGELVGSAAGSALGIGGVKTVGRSISGWRKRFAGGDKNPLGRYAPRADGSYYGSAPTPSLRQGDLFNDLSIKQQEMFSGGLGKPMPTTLPVTTTTVVPKVEPSKWEKAVETVKGYGSKFVSVLKSPLKGLVAAGSMALGVFAGLAIGLKIVSGAAKEFKKNFEEAVSVNGIKLMLDEINKLKGSVEQNVEMVKVFGANGQEEYRKLTEKVKEYDKAQKEAYETTGNFQLGSTLVIEKLGRAWAWGKSVVGKTVDVIGNLFTASSAGYSILFEKISGGRFGGIATKEMVAEMAAGEARVKKMQADLDKAIIATAKKREEAAKAKEKAKEKADKDWMDQQMKNAEDLLDSQDKLTKAKEDTFLEEAKIAEKIAYIKKKRDEIAAGARDENQGTRIQNDLLVQQLALEEQLLKLKREQAKENLDAGDKQRLSLNELAGMDGQNRAQNANIGTAKKIQSLEANAKQLLAGGDKKGFAKLMGEAAGLRQGLGVGGILQSDEFTMPANKINPNKRYTVADMIKLDPSLKKDYDNLQALQRSLNAYGPGPDDKFNPISEADQASARRNIGSMIEAQQRKITEKVKEANTEDPLLLMAKEFQRQGNALPVIPKNGA